MRIWPFVTRSVYTLQGKKVVWLSRMHRKGLTFENQLLRADHVPFWRTEAYNKNIGVSFAVGAALFALASILMFISLARPALSNLTNLTFFLGSVPFTIEDRTGLA
ncbi:hypothetical protein CWE02_09160 [Brucella pituitosa]|nr:hypothetical protein CWE02_09160 [Brucella pituitosa]